jgi:hypothetical protein
MNIIVQWFDETKDVAAKQQLATGMVSSKGYHSYTKHQDGRQILDAMNLE